MNRRSKLATARFDEAEASALERLEAALDARVDALVRLVADGLAVDERAHASEIAAEFGADEGAVLAYLRAKLEPAREAAARKGATS
ncbi:MAG TPA: hypothetical protein VFS43_40710 [Polyangiaceae bacterium]|nr:hypothetical protein [Polyangiaceae bacterium]